MARGARPSDGAQRWPETGIASVSATAQLAAALSLGVFMLALESERLSALVQVNVYASVAPLPTSLITLVAFLVGAAFVCSHPRRRPASLGAVALTALVCSLGICSMYFLHDSPSVWPLQLLGDIAFSVSPPVLVFFWLQRAAPFGERFVIRSFGAGAITLGCLSMLSAVLEHTVALVFVAALPLVGAALLSAVNPQQAPCEAELDGSDAGASWNALRAIAGLCDSGPGRDPCGSRQAGSGARSASHAILKSLVKLVPFFCYALIFGCVHFSWVILQGEESVGFWVQMGASVGSVVCGGAAFALAGLHWGRALESIVHLLLAVFAIVALWLATFLTSGYVFAYLVLLNIAQKLAFMLMLIFGFPLSRNASQVTSLWALAYLSFFFGTFVSSRIGTSSSTLGLNLVAAAALALLLVIDVIGVAGLYSVKTTRGNEAPGEPGAQARNLGQSEATGETEGTPGVSAPGTAGPQGPATLAAVGAPGAQGAQGAQGAGPVALDGQAAARPAEGFELLPYTCHLIAAEYDLTRREEEIMQLLVRGRTAARIAETLCITTATTRTHLRNIYAKLGVHSQQDVLDMYEEFAQRAQG